MSENLGVQVELTANAAGFITAINNAKDKLVDLSLQAKNLKQGERDIEKALADAARQYGENSKQVERYKNDLIDNKRAQLDVRNETNQVNAELRKQRTAFAQATQPAESYSNALSDTARSNEKLTTTLKSGFLALKGIAVGYAGKTLYEALIGSNAEFEQHMTSFDVLLGSAEKAEAMMGELEQFAAVTPLKTEDVTEATQLLLGYGLAEEEIMTTMQQLGDVAQGNAEKLNRVALAYGQMLAKGKVSGEELRQMTEAGVPLTNALAEALDVTTAELSKLIEEGEVGIPTLNQALENMTSEGGQFFGMMEKQSQTLNGLLSTMSDNATIFAREVGDEAFNYLKDELQDVMNTIQQMSEDGSLQEIASGMGEGIANAITFVVDFIKLLWEMRDVIMLVGGAVLTYKAAMAGLAALQSVIAWGKGVKTTLEAVNTAKQAGITISTLYKAAILQDAVALQACNAAGIKDIATKGGQTVATNAATGATLKFNAALLANPYVLIAAGLVAVTALLISFGTAQDRARKKAEEAAQAYQETKDELESAKTELEEVNKKIDELNAKEKLTFTEKGELEQLQQQNKELGTRIILLQKEAELKAQESDKALEESYEADFKNNREKATSTTVSQEVYTAGRLYSTTSSVASGTINEEEYVKEQIESLSELNALKREGGEVDKTTYENLISYLTDAGKRYQELADNYTKDNELKQHWLDMTDSIAKALDPDNYNAIKFEDVFDAESFAENKEKLLELASAGQITPEVIESYSEFQNLMSNTGLTAQEIADEITRIAGASEESAEQVQTLSDTIASLSTASDDIGSVTNALKEFDENGTASIKTISEINSAFGDLEGYGQFIDTLTSSESTYEDVREAAEKLIDEYLNSSDAINGLDESNKELIATQLEAMGITNAQELTTEALKNKFIETTLSQFDLKNATAESTQALLEQASEAGFTKEEIQGLESAINFARSGNIDFKTATVESIQALVDEGVISEETGNTIIWYAYQCQLASASVIDTSSSIKNLVDLAMSLDSTSDALTNYMTLLSLTSASASEIAAHGGEAKYAADIAAAQSALKSSLSKVKVGGGNRTGVSYTPPASSQAKRSSGGSKSSGDDAEKARKEQLSAYEADIEEKERLDERWYNREKEFGRMTDEQWLEGLANRADRYRAYADEVLTLSFATEEEKAELRKEYLEKAEDVDLEYFKYYKGLVEEETQARKDVYEERREDSDKWLAQMEEEGNFDAVIEGLERVKVYTADYYEGEKAKLDEFLQAGIYSQEEYNEALKDLQKEMNEEMEGLNEDTADAKRGKFDAWYDDAQDYIGNRNFYGDWSKWGDSEEQAIARMFAKIDEARANKIISQEEYFEMLDTLSEQIYTLEYDNMQEAIQEQEELLKEKYQKELDMKTEAAQKEIEVAKEKAEAEKEAINEAADNEIKRIDELIQKRKEAREDEDNNLKLARLQAKLAYEHDENNRIALQKEIDKLLQEMADIQFERDMEQQKELIETNRDAALQGVENALDLAIESAERKITIANNRYEEQTSGINMAMELAKIFNLQSFEDIYKTIGVDIESGITKGLQGIFDALSSSLNEVAGVKTSNYDYSTSGNTYKMYNTFSGVRTPAEVAQALRRLLDQIELEGYM